MNNLLSLIDNTLMIFNTFLSFSSIMGTIFQQFLSSSQTLFNHLLCINVLQMLSVAFLNKSVCIDWIKALLNCDLTPSVVLYSTWQLNFELSW